MQYNLNASIEILSQTPGTLKSMLGNLNPDWIKSNEGPNSWSPYDVVGHLIHGEKTDWIDRIEICLGMRNTDTFTPFDRFAQERDSVGKSISDLLNEFQILRSQNLLKLQSYKITPDQLQLKGYHPSLGGVTLGNLLSTWTVHDLGHIAQISRVLATQYNAEVGPWKEYLRILQ
ncbi:DinB family protein [Luteibaculum oceani]|uniref:DinB family protein n=1 Tax=Luteibaculum oceani TaxID=1294296 RepID=A0A5C6V0C8_9FLAO|nr:DinB family protein [Luteibaculum oceani]TXC78619.1 DinB family protein [Luteibaculum oceani]